MPLTLLLCLWCLFIVIVSGALQFPLAMRELATQARQEQAAALKHAKQGDHVNAARSHSSAAEHYKILAAALDGQGLYQNAAALYYKTATLHATAGEHEMAVLLGAMIAFEAVGERERVSFVRLIAEYVDMGKRQEQGSMHKIAAHCCRMTATMFSLAGHAELAQALSQAAIRHYEASVQCALDVGNHEAAARVYSLAAKLHTLLDDPNTAKALRQAEAQQHRARAMSRLAYGDHQNAALSYRKAAEACRAIGDEDGYHSMNEAAAGLYEARAAQLAAQGDRWHAALSNRGAADAYEAIGQSDKARLLRRASAQQHEGHAAELVAQGDRQGAARLYIRAARAYDMLGEAEKAESMRREAARLEKVCCSRSGDAE